MQKPDKLKQSLDQVSKLFGQNAFAKHLAAGTASGWVTGVVVRHTGKTVALVLGSGIILYQIAHHHGYVKQDWESLKDLAKQKTCELKHSSPAVNKVRAVATKNRVFTAGFLGGFLIGLAI